MYVFLTPLFHLWDDDISPFTILVQLTSILTQKECANHFFALNKSCRARKNEFIECLKNTYSQCICKLLNLVLNEHFGLLILWTLPNPSRFVYQNWSTNLPKPSKDPKLWSLNLRIVGVSKMFGGEFQFFTSPGCGFSS